MPAVKILLWHGYLLTGSGSNLYTANLARVWRRSGHDVLLLCQEQHAELFAFVDWAGDFGPDNRGWSPEPVQTQDAAGRCRLIRPAIGEVLPVYVLDAYEGFVAKRFVDLDDRELDTYTKRNIDALSTALERFAPDAIVTGHEVMGPHIARRACERAGGSYLAKLHGSALEYAVKPQIRYREYARSGLGAARVVAGGSRYMIEEASTVVPGWRERAVVVNPGCDVELFRPIDRPASWPPVIGFVGKLIGAKGVHNLLSALPLASIRARATIVGFGDIADALGALWRALQAGDQEPARAIARALRLAHLTAWLNSGGLTRAYARRASEIDVRFVGRMEHGPLSKLLPTFDVLVVPSVVPEAFGMVAAEAAASGVLPVVPRHSGIGEVGAVLEEELGIDGLLTYDPAEPIEGIASALERVLGLDPARRQALGRSAADVARRLWSWERVADRLLALAIGSPDPRKPV